jgi:hypothetical protein
VVRLRISLTLYPGRDDRLIAFLHDQPRRGIARAIKQALLTGIGPLTPATDATAETVDEALDNLL